MRDARPATTAAPRSREAATVWTLWATALQVIRGWLLSPVAPPRMVWVMMSALLRMGPVGIRADLAATKAPTLPFPKWHIGVQPLSLLPGPVVQEMWLLPRAMPLKGKRPVLMLCSALQAARVLLAKPSVWVHSLQLSDLWRLHSSGLAAERPVAARMAQTLLSPGAQLDDPLAASKEVAVLAQLRRSLLVGELDPRATSREEAELALGGQAPMG